MICFGNKIIDKAFLGEIEITNAFFGESSMLDYLPYLLIDKKEVAITCEPQEVTIQILTNNSYTINL